VFHQRCNEKHICTAISRYSISATNDRVALEMNDEELAAIAMKDIEGNRLTYRPTIHKVSRRQVS
jgi:hypothetical protein